MYVHCKQLLILYWGNTNCKYCSRCMRLSTHLHGSNKACKCLHAC